ncbi:Citrate synthase 1 [Bacillus sp. THAF10]|uniref:citrate synthase/methylcitrate synthase n=1 Tax=Bacillus sp. THAF10 TaxID=2587848 RepID=UPI00126895DA|nr:citrate synthase/methylcitrate synthase [Bacillus sp. THAF10]QFT89146.1 Citrate synthase 1 [Bacillus sp. THAF10]
MEIQKGLKGVVVSETQIGEVDGTNGRLVYRGYEIGELASAYTFEEIAYLIWHGELPSPEQRKKIVRSFKEKRGLSPVMENVLKALPKNMELMNVLRTVLSAEGDNTYSSKPTIEEAIRLTAVTPTIIASRFRQLKGQTMIAPDANLGHVENYLYMLTGERIPQASIRVLETYMNLTMEHGMNASTFSARVTTSTQSDMVSAVISAIGTMKGPLHGGAPSEVIALLDELSQVENIEMHLREKVRAGEKLMGFGHRVYKTSDPRAVALKKLLTDSFGKNDWLDFSILVEQYVLKVLAGEKPGKSLHTNVEYYAAAIMKALAMQPSLFTPTFTASRMVGWTAHVLEQAEENVIFRPLSKYIGPKTKKVNIT